MTDAEEFFSAVRSGAVVQNDGVPRDGHGRYELPREMDGSGDVVGHTRVTTIASTLTGDGYGLTAWKQRLIARGMGLRRDLADRAAALPEDDPTYKDVMNSIVQAAMVHAGVEYGANRGTALHGILERVLKGESLATIPEQFHPDVTALLTELERENIIIMPTLAERVVKNWTYGFVGKVDAIGLLSDGTYAVLDVKSEKDPSEFPHSKVVQLAEYTMCTHMMNYETQQYEELPPLRQDFAIIAHIRPDSGVCKLLRVPIDLGHVGVRVSLEAAAWRKTTIVVSAFTDASLRQLPISSVATANAAQARPAAHAAQSATSLQLPAPVALHAVPPLPTPPPVTEAPTADGLPSGMAAKLDELRAGCPHGVDPTAWCIEKTDELMPYPKSVLQQICCALDPRYSMNPVSAELKRQKKPLIGIIFGLLGFQESAPVAAIATQAPTEEIPAVDPDSGIIAAIHSAKSLDELTAVYNWHIGRHGQAAWTDRLTTIATQHAATIAEGTAS